MEKSLWQKDNNLRNLSLVNEDKQTDILIIGAGITGVSTCYNLLNTDFDIILIDRGLFFNEVTAKSTGKITYLQDLKYQEILGIYGFETAKLYYESQKEAIRIIKKNIKENDIECNFEKSESITFTNDEKQIPKFIKEEEFFNKIGVRYSNNVNNKNFKAKRLISVKNTYVFNPVKYLKGLLKEIKNNKNIRLYENSVATKIRKEDGYYVTRVNDFDIKSKKVVVACNYPFFTIPGFIPLKTYLEK